MLKNNFDLIAKFPRVLLNANAIPLHLININTINHVKSDSYVKHIKRRLL